MQTYFLIFESGIDCSQELHHLKQKYVLHHNNFETERNTKNALERKIETENNETFSLKQRNELKSF